MFLCVDSPQSDIFASGVQPVEQFFIKNQINQVISLSVSHPVRVFEAVNSVSPGLCACEISHSGVFLAERSANQLS